MNTFTALFTHRSTSRRQHRTAELAQRQYDQHQAQATLHARLV